MRTFLTATTGEGEEEEDDVDVEKKEGGTSIKS